MPAQREEKGACDVIGKAGGSAPLSGETESRTSGEEGEACALFLFHGVQEARLNEEHGLYESFKAQACLPSTKQEHRACQFIGKDWEPCGTPSPLRFLVPGEDGGGRSLFLCSRHKRLIERRTRCDAMDDGKQCHVEALRGERLCGEHLERHKKSKEGRSAAVLSWLIYQSRLKAARERVASEVVRVVNAAPDEETALSFVRVILSRDSEGVETWGGPVPIRPPPVVSRIGRHVKKQPPPSGAPPPEPPTSGAPSS